MGKTRYGSSGRMRELVTGTDHEVIELESGFSCPATEANTGSPDEFSGDSNAVRLGKINNIPNTPGSTPEYSLRTSSPYSCSRKSLVT